MLVDETYLLSSVVEAQRHADQINAYWEKLGQDAGARVVPMFDHRDKLKSFGVSSDVGARASMGINRVSQKAS
jgi:hypothetical protein